MSPINYIRRKAENLSTAIEQIYGLRVNNEADKSLKLASETFSSLLNYDLGKILETDTDTFIGEILQQDYSPDFLDSLINFMLETAEVFDALKRSDESKILKIKSLKLLEYLTNTDKTYSDERLQLITKLKTETE